MSNEAYRSANLYQVSGNITSQQVSKIRSEMKVGDVVFMKGGMYIYGSDKEFHGPTTGKIYPGCGWPEKYPLQHWDKVFQKHNVKIKWAPNNLQEIMSTLKWLSFTQASIKMNDATLLINVEISKKHGRDRYSAMRNLLVSEALSKCYVRPHDFEDHFSEYKCSRRVGYIYFECETDVVLQEKYDNNIPSPDQLREMIKISIENEGGRTAMSDESVEQLSIEEDDDSYESYDSHSMSESC